MNIRLRLIILSALISGAVLVFAPSGSEARTWVRADPFRHSTHVSNSWMDENTREVKRDCQGCHDYYSSPTISDPEPKCNDCHYGNPEGKFPRKVDGSLAAKRDLKSPFKHFDHANVDCRACHKPDNRTTVPDELPIPEGLGWCLKCHDESYTLPAEDRAQLSDGRQKALQGRLENFSTKLNSCERMLPRDSVTFSHHDHMKPGELNDPKACDACHQAMATADAKFGEKIVDEQGCKACHITLAGRSGTPDDFFKVEASRPKPSLSDGTFYHKDHMSPDALKHPDIGDKGCLACHRPETDAESGGGTVASYTFQDKFNDFKNYDSCLECHYHAQEERAKYFVADHSQVGSFTCYKCHEFGKSPMAHNRPMVTTQRVRPVKYAIKVQAHPHITTATPASDAIADCKKCHRTETATVPSRLKNNRFDHRPHLPPNPTTKDCALCHSIDKDGMIQQVVADGKLMTFKPDVCNSCHRDQDNVVAVEVLEETQTVPLFPHDLHVGKKGIDGKVMDCAACHQLEAQPVGSGNQARDFSFKTGVKDCRACHDHGQYTEFTGKKDRTYVQSCGSCHKNSVNPAESDIPKPGTSIPIARSFISGINLAQFHPNPQDQACGTCHNLAPASFRRDPLRAIEITNLRTRGIDYHEEFKLDRTPCMFCHWNQATDSKYYRGSPDNLRSEPDFRSALGNSLANFPGGKK